MFHRWYRPDCPSYRRCPVGSRTMFLSKGVQKGFCAGRYATDISIVTYLEVGLHDWQYLVLLHVLSVTQPRRRHDFSASLQSRCKDAARLPSPTNSKSRTEPLAPRSTEQAFSASSCGQKGVLNVRPCPSPHRTANTSNIEPSPLSARYFPCDFTRPHT